MDRCLAITPARDEQGFLPGLIQSMTTQTHKPGCWIVVDDGSTDRTAEILESARAENPWIEVHHLPTGRQRAFGGESVVMQFLRAERLRNYDFILRLDADLTFAPTLIESLLAEFAKDKTLGVGGAVLYEPRGSQWRRVSSPRFHTRGAVKMYSRTCFEAIGGLQSGVGWDTIDEAHAMMLGFGTRNFPAIGACHHRPQGAAGGLLRSRFSTGRTAYVVGYAPLFMLMRSFRHLFGSPPLVGSIMMWAGFLDGYFHRLPRTASPELVKFIRRQQRRRLLMMDSLWR
jgi:biofilm PGA synthesis N-glycosyltransferase PgaC